jgi:fructose-1,6-bisphosphatase/sedoheptulose 1,7-bisphosphatase-like protein
MAADAAMGSGDDDEADDQTVDVGHEAANEAGSSGADVVISVGEPVLYIEAQLVRANRET